MPKQTNYKNLDPKKKKFVKEVIKHGNLTEAAMNSYNPKTRKTAGTMGSQLIKREDIKEELQKQLEAQGLDFKYILGKRKMLISKGVKDLDDQIVPASVLGKTLKDLEDLWFKLEGGSKNQLSNLHQHVHLHNQTSSELLDKRNELNDYFSKIIEDQTPTSDS